MKRCDLRGAFELPLAPDAAFPLFTARGEREWVPGWEPTFVHPQDGELELDQVFCTGAGAERVIWSVIRLDRSQREVEYLRVQPELRVARVAVRVDALSAGCRVEVRYLCTALGATGEKALALFAQGFDDMLVEWRRLLLARRAEG